MKKNYLFILALLSTTLSFGQNSGDIIITEILQNPKGISDPLGEYFEVYNTTGTAIDLINWTIRDNGTNLDTIELSLMVPPNGFAVLGKNADMATNGNIAIDYEYSQSISLANSSDALVLKKADQTTIDSLRWDNGATFPDPDGKSMNLDPGSFDGTANDDGSNWCEATSPLGSQFGTPGTTNDACAPPCTFVFGATSTLCDSSTLGIDTYTANILFTGGGSQSYTITPSTGTLSGDDPSVMASGSIIVGGIAEGTNLSLSLSSISCDLSININSPLCDPFSPICVNEGDLIFTEVMQNPNAVSDGVGEWFEIHNTTMTDIDLHGYDIIDDNHTLEEEGFSIGQTLIIPANGFLLFANNGDMATNGGTNPDWVYDPDLTLGNGNDGITIQCDGNIIDSIGWDDGSTFPDPTGKSMSLDPGSFNSIDNNDGNNWCEAISLFATDFGTPGIDNDACPPPCILTLGDIMALCDSSTLGVDTYTVSIAFTEGGTHDITITPSTGTVSGDDPTVMASGNIIIGGIAEGTNLTVSISGETCDFTENINSPVCDPFSPTCVNEGDLIFTEVMQNPNAVPDSMGEWFEIHNTTMADIDLHGYDIIDDNHTLEEEGFTIGQTLIIPAGGFLLFANNGDMATNGGTNPDWAYDPDLTLGNGNDGIIIKCDGNTIDSIRWDNGSTFPDPTGKSMSLDPGSFNSTANNDGNNWCEAISLFATDFGTPGMDNDVCPAPCLLILGDITALCDSSTLGVDTYTTSIAFTGGGMQNVMITSSAGTVSGDNPSMMSSGNIIINGVAEGTNLTVSISGGACNFTENINSPVCDPFTPICVNTGDLIFTEIMQNPDAVSDDMGEWFEIYNTTAAAIDLHGYDIIDDDHTLPEEGFTISETLMIPAGDFLLFANNGDAATNGGLSPDWVYDPSLTIGNGTDGITIQCDGNIIDIVVWDNGATFPDPTGKSMNLSPGSFNSTANDDGANWCEAISQYATDFGTPGTANDNCAAPCPLDLGASTAICDAITDDVDTYTATLEFSGGATQSYSTTASTGILSGDDPSLVASGTITVTGIAEGTDLVISVSGGTCQLMATINSAVCVPSLCADAGSVILTEVMQNPSAVSDAMGEWFELYNTTATAINLQGWEINDDDMAGEGFTIATPLVIAPNGYLVFANNGDAATNGGISPDYIYDPSLTLGNGTDGLRIECDGSLIDIVIWDDGLTFPDPSGSSMSLSTLHLNAAENNIGDFWGAAITPYGDGDLGTPGALNDYSTAVRDLDIEGLKVFPNPALGQIYISTSNASLKEVDLYNVLGEKVFSTSFEGNLKDIPLESFSAGFYVLKIKDGKRVAVVNVIVQ